MTRLGTRSRACDADRLGAQQHRQRSGYGGACGYLSFAGDMDVVIAICTGIVKAQMLYVEPAAGVVADSVPELEWRDTEARARAAELVEEGF